MSSSSGADPTTGPHPDAEKHNVFFLKVHKCGSSTIQNILMRYGLDNLLDFVLPSKGNYLGSPRPFGADLIPDDLRTPGGRYNMLTHHSRWSRAGVARVMYRGAVWVTVLRHPAALYESLFSYYNLEKFFNVSLRQVAEDPSSYPEVGVHRLNNRIGSNQMCWDLGLDPRHFDDDVRVGQLISRVDESFHLVLISEYMEASLVLLADALRWPLDRVASLKLNARSPDRRLRLSPLQTDNLLRINSADLRLYQHFLDRFKRAVESFGRERMTAAVERLVSLDSHLYIGCVAKSNNAGYGKTVAYNVTDSPRCRYAALPELEFTDQLRRLQKQRLNTIKQLYRFLH